MIDEAAALQLAGGTTLADTLAGQAVLDMARAYATLQEAQLRVPRMPRNGGVNADFDLASGVNTTYYTGAAMELRELNHGGPMSGALAEAPRLSFHWGGRVASQIALSTDGTGMIRDNPGTGYENLAARNITANGRLTSGEFVQVNGVAGEGGCSPNGLVGQAGSGKLLSCQSGVWAKAAGNGSSARKFGGTYFVQNGGCNGANPATGACNCPAGYSANIQHLDWWLYTLSILCVHRAVMHLLSPCAVNPRSNRAWTRSVL